MQQLVDVVQRYLLAQPTTKCGMQVLGGKEIPGCSPCEMLGEELALLLQ